MARSTIAQYNSEIVQRLAASWIRKVTKTTASMEIDDVAIAAASVADAEQLEHLTQPIAFSMGADFGFRVGLAVLANPLDAERATADAIEATQADLLRESERERLEGELFAARAKVGK